METKVVIVMPAYNAAKTIKDTYKEISLKYRKQIILVDDNSKDGTSGTARKLGIKVYEHSNNLGYGGNQKTCYWEALKLNPDVVVMLHPDYQYDATKIKDLVDPILSGDFDFMFGSRIRNRGSALAGGMPKIKYYVNRAVCLLQNILLGENYSEYFSGFRAYSKNLLKTVPFQRFSNDFVFDQEMTISSISYGMKIGEIPIPTRYHEKQSSINFLKGTKFVIEGFLTILAFDLNNWGIRRDRRFASSFQRGNLPAIVGLGLASVLILIPFAKLHVYSIFVPIVALGTTTLFYLFNLHKKLNKYFFLFFTIFMVLLIAILFRGYSDKNLFLLSRLDANRMATEDRFLRIGLVGQLYGRKAGYFYFTNVKFHIDRTLEKIAYPLDTIKYFASSHNRIYSYIFFPPFVLGLAYMLRYKAKNLFGYLFISSVGSVIIAPSQTLILYFPLISVLTGMGIYYFFIIFSRFTVKK